MESWLRPSRIISHWSSTPLPQTEIWYAAFPSLHLLPGLYNSKRCIPLLSSSLNASSWAHLLSTYPQRNTATPEPASHGLRHSLPPRLQAWSVSSYDLLSDRSEEVRRKKVDTACDLVNHALQSGRPLNTPQGQAISVSYSSMIAPTNGPPCFLAQPQRLLASVHAPSCSMHEHRQLRLLVRMMLCLACPVLSFAKNNTRNLATDGNITIDGTGRAPVTCVFTSSLFCSAD